MEYLMTYGWAILVVMIVGVVLWQLGIFGPSSTVNTCRGFSKVKVFDNSIRYDPTTEKISFTMMNGAGQTITDVVITATCPYANPANPSVNFSQISAGDTIDISFTCDPKQPGETFSVPITVAYNETVVGTKVPRTETGTCRGSAEKA
ncbi:MAG: hypothetical protein QXY62_00755 [Candidatus Altiarchaeota archaeon]